MAVLDAQGAVVRFKDDAGTPAYQIVGGVTSFSFGDGEAADIDVTTLASTAKQYNQGLQDFGGLTLELIRDPADVGQAEMLDAKAKQEARDVQITFASADVATFQAYVKSLSTTGAVDGVLTGTANLKITGSITWS